MAEFTRGEALARIASDASKARARAESALNNLRQLDVSVGYVMTGPDPVEESDMAADYQNALSDLGAAERALRHAAGAMALFLSGQFTKTARN